MDKRLKKTKRKKHKRTLIQILFVAATNGYYRGFAEGTIYRGDTKQLCLPGLNCYSCPGALGACPIGAMQNVLGHRDFHVSLYLMGFFTMIGALLGRFVCGWLCPFGLAEDLLYKIPFVKKYKNLPGDKVLRYLKYGILAGFVILLPMFAVNTFGQGKPWFCEYVCPSGTLMAGWPLGLLNEGIRSAWGFLFAYKTVFLVVLILLSILVYRPFCKYLCPLGAIYGWFNRVALYGYTVEKERCTGCGACAAVCDFGIDPSQTPNSAECIRCGQCLRICPAEALQHKCRMKNNTGIKREEKREEVK